MKKSIMCLGVAAMASFGAAEAAVVFSGTDGTLDFNASSGSYSLSGVQVTLQANDGIVNATGSGLGVNDSGSGDDTDGLDTVNLVETLTFIFDVDVIFDSITLSSVGVNDAVNASFNGGPASLLSSSGQHNFGTFLAAGQTLVLTAAEPNAPIANNGVTTTQFTVTAVPEPSSAFLLGLGGLLAIVRRRR